MYNFIAMSKRCIEDVFSYLWETISHLNKDFETLLIMVMSYILISVVCQTLIKLGMHIPEWFSSIKNCLYISFILTITILSKSKLLFDYIKTVFSEAVITEKRQENREKCNFGVNATSIALKTKIAVTTHDKSCKGLCVIIDKNLATVFRNGQTFRISNGKGHKLYTVKWSRAYSDHFKVGLCVA